MIERFITVEEVSRSAIRVAREIRTIEDSTPRPGYPNVRNPTKLYGVPRGGIPAAFAVQAGLVELSRPAVVVDNVMDADYIVDDLIDSGTTREQFSQACGTPFFALFHKHDPAEWFVFPWEGGSSGSQEDIVIRTLQAIGEDTTREGLRDTPTRVVKAWQTWFSGYSQKPADVLKVFEDGAEQCDEMVIETDIPVYSFCEHHMAPIFGVAHVAYIPDGKVVGLSKLARVVDIYARRLQVQERLTNQIATALSDHLNPKGVGVILQCRHLCMESRGIERHGVVTTTSALRGAIKQEHETRAEFLSLIGALKSRHNPIL